MRWWLEGLQENLSQGDILGELGQGTLVEPTTHLRHTTMSKGASGWAETPNPVSRNNRFHFLAAGSISYSIVLSHDCELDKVPVPSRALVAPLLPLSTLSPQIQDKVLEMKVWALAGIPNVPGLGSFYADLRSITAADRNAMLRVGRVASMTPEAVNILRARLVGYFTRLNV